MSPGLLLLPTRLSVLHAWDHTMPLTSEEQERRAYIENTEVPLVSLHQSELIRDDEVTDLTMQHEAEIERLEERIEALRAALEELRHACPIADKALNKDDRS